MMKYVYVSGMRYLMVTQGLGGWGPLLSPLVAKRCQISSDMLFSANYKLFHRVITPV